jgi:5-methylcytosine-specific restriction protein A
MRKRVVDFAAALPVHAIDLGSMARLPGDYVAGHALGVSYSLDSLPAETSLRTDLQTIVRAYRALTYRGGTDADVETQTDLAEEFGIPQSMAVTETRKYAYHRKVERSRTATKRRRNFMARGARPRAASLGCRRRYAAWRPGAGLLRSMSALPPKAAATVTDRRVRFGPKGDIARP